MCGEREREGEREGKKERKRERDRERELPAVLSWSAARCRGVFSVSFLGSIKAPTYIYIYLYIYFI